VLFFGSEPGTCKKNKNTFAIDSGKWGGGIEIKRKSLYCDHLNLLSSFDVSGFVRFSRFVS